MNQTKQPFNLLDTVSCAISGQPLARAFRHQHPAVAAKVRKEIAAAWRILKISAIQYYSGSLSQTRLVVRRALRIMYEAMLDCFEADKRRGLSKHRYHFLNRLEFTSPAQLSSVAHFSLRPELLNWENAETREAWESENLEAATVKHWLHIFRRNIRHQMSPRDALTSFSDYGVMRHMAEHGYESFFIGLGDILRKPCGQEGLHSRIINAWVPLNLGDCGPDGVEAHRRFEEYSRALGRNSEDYIQFKRGWNNVRNRALRQLVVAIRMAPKLAAPAHQSKQL
jgi:hypothetical protein